MLVIIGLQYETIVAYADISLQESVNTPFSCEAGSCATCMAKLVEGTVSMHVNNALTDDEVAEGWILTCQAVPTSPSVRAVYSYEEG